LTAHSKAKEKKTQEPRRKMTRKTNSKGIFSSPAIADHKDCSPVVVAMPATLATQEAEPGQSEIETLSGKYPTPKGLECGSSGSVPA
jgi:hypothetical protein